MCACDLGEFGEEVLVGHLSRTLEHTYGMLLVHISPNSHCAFFAHDLSS